MKLNFRKIASVLTSTLMVGSTVALAAAANYPAPFVNNGSANVNIVYGSAGMDLAAVADITASLSGALTQQTASGSSTVTTVSGEAKAIETAGQKLYLGDFMNTTKQTFSKVELPNVLADGSVTDSDGTSYNYNLKIQVPNTFVDYGKTTDNLATPILYMDFPNSNRNYSMDVVFPTAVNTSKLTDKEITLFGKKYTFSGSITDLTSSKVVLYESAQTQTVKSGESTDVTVGGKGYTVAVVSVEDGSTAVISVNGVSQKVSETNSYKVNGLDMYVKNVFGPNVAGENRGVELSFGSAKMTLENGQSVVKGSTTIYGTTVVFTNSGASKVSKISIQVAPYSLDNQVKYLAAGNSSLTDPVFGAFKISFAGATPDLADASKDKIVIKPSAESKASLGFTNYMGHEYNFNMLKTSNGIINSTGQFNTTNGNINVTALAVDDYDLVTNSTTGINQSDYFIVTSGRYSQIFQVSRIDANNKEVRVRDVYSGSGSSAEQKLSVETTGNTTSLSLDDSSSVTLTVDKEWNGLRVASKIVPWVYTEGGSLINLSNANGAAASRVDIVEKTTYSDGKSITDANGNSLGGNVNVTLKQTTAGRTGYDLEVKTVNVDGVTDSQSSSPIQVGDYDTYYLTKYGSFVKSSGNNDKTVEMNVPSGGASLGVFIGETSASISSSDGSVKDTGTLPVKDTEVASVAGKNLIVVGGSCINTVAAELLGVTAGTCGDGFTAKTGVGAGSFLIQTFARGNGNVATLVAGYNLQDTANAAKFLTTSTVDTTVGKKYTGTSATSAQLITN